MFGFKIKQGTEEAYSNPVHASHQEQNKQAREFYEMLKKLIF